uniref:Lysophosphatidylserine lipase ABHD12 n=1 Tax=Panagrellus redivivus TaxID=6233 RepID=A0A7E4UVG3_PANRE
MGSCSLAFAILRRSFYLAVLPLAGLYVLVPLLFQTVPEFMQHAFFLNFVKVPFLDYTNLTYHGVAHLGRNFRLPEIGARVLCKGEEPVLGVWHVLPASLSRRLEAEIEAGTRKPLTDADYEALLDAESHGVVVYFHGNSFDRTNAHRVDLYNRLADLDFHVLAIDYRGYGDSTGFPSEDGLIEDAHFIYNYARARAPTKNIYVWGHSMGTGVSARFVAELSDLGIPPVGTVLESPFNNLHDVVTHHPLSRPYRWLGERFNRLIVDRWVDSGLVMHSDERIVKHKAPLLILHAADDHIIPVKLGKKLFEAADKAGVDVKYVEFEANLGLRHKFIHKAPHLADILKEFFQRCEAFTTSRKPTKRHEEVHIDA